MAENSKGGILNQAGKILRRRKTKVLQSLGKTGKTTDETLGEDVHRLERQLEVGIKFQKDLRNYIQHARAMSVASKTFYTTLTETYEAEWENHAQVTEILTNMDMLWQDYLQKLQEQVQDPLSKYLSVIPQIKARVSKRGRKLIDYDNAKHGLEVQQNAKKKDDAKITKAHEDMEGAKKIYEDLNNELHQELPEFYNSRLRFYGNTFQSLFDAETVFQTEAGKGTQQICDSAEKLAKDNDQYAYTPRKNQRNTMVVGSDENLTNGHSESGPDSPQPDSPSPSTSPTSPAPQQPLVNGNGDADTSRESIEDEPYENTEFKDSEAAGQKGEEQEPTAKGESSDIEAKGEPVAPVAAPRPEITKEDKEVEPPAQNNDLDIKVNGDVDEAKVNGDLDTSTSTEQEVPDDAPPPPPSSLPPDVDVEKSEDKLVETDEPKTSDTQNEDDNGDVDEDLYQVPPPAKPIDDDIPQKYLYTVIATHLYTGEDEDELTFDAKEVIYVMEYDDPEEQDPGWLMGMRKKDRKCGVFPENFTKRV